MAFSITEIKRANKEGGFHFFDKSTMEFFNSKVYPHVYDGPGGIYFVTGEKMREHSHLRYTVRRFHPLDGHISNCSVFGEYADAAVAFERAKDAASLPG